MEVYALDKTNVEDFSHLITTSAVEEILQETGTHGFVVKAENQHVGALCGRFVDAGAYEIRSLYVLPEYRKQGVGKLLLQTLGDVLPEAAVEVSAAVIELDKDTKELAGFLEAEDFEPYACGEAHVCMVTMKDLAGSKLLGNHKKPDYETFAGVPKKTWTRFAKKKPTGFVPVPKNGLLSDSVDREVSTAVVKEDEILGYAVVEVVEEDLLFLSSLYVSPKERSTTLLKLLRSTLLRAMEKYGEKTKVLLAPVNEDSEKLYDVIFEGKRPKDLLTVYKKTMGENKRIYGSELPLADFLAEEWTGTDMVDQLSIADLQEE